MYKVFVINLDKDSERLSFMSRQLSDIGMQYERLSAINGREYVWSEQVYDSKKSIIENGKDLTEGERGCAFSHRQCCDKLLQSDSEYALILEDDVEIPKDFKFVVEKMIKENNNKEWEYLAFDYPEPGIFFWKHWIESLPLSYNNLKVKSVIIKVKFVIYTLFKFIYISSISIFEGMRNNLYKIFRFGNAVKFYRPVYFASAYMVSRSGAEKLIKLNTPIVYAADRVQNVARVKSDLKWRAYAPLITRQRREDFGSSLLGVTGEHFKK